MAEGSGASDGSAIRVERELCIGSGMCLVYAPGTFTHDDQAKAVVLDPVTDPPDVVRTAVEACPTGALRLLADPSGGRDRPHGRDERGA